MRIAPSLPLLIVVGLALATTVRAQSTGEVRFNRDIRPILSNNCFYCHGPDPKHREADLRLDTSEGALAMAIVPGKPDESPLIERVSSLDPDALMPPPASKKAKLSTEQIATLRRWIEQGAKYEGHWAFLPLSSVQPPSVKNEAWVKTPIDRFILARLEQEGIAPSPEADAATLIRRLSLDLTGLLPSPEDVEAFRRELEQDRDAAYRALVERLLVSPHYGERWGRHWLDQARYADSSGYSIDSERAMWPYRDWVIQSLNDDLPFDQFTIEQLAGDLLPDATKRQVVATAFHRNTLVNEEGGTDPQQFRHEAVVDRVNTTAAVWLGLTVGCAQCHTHKFDPITHREYYELFAFFNNTTDVNNKGATVKVARGEMLGEKPQALPPPPEADPEFAKRQAEWEVTQQAALAEADGSSKPKIDAKLAEAFQLPADKRNADQAKLVRDAFIAADPRSKAAKTRRDQAAAKTADLMVMKELDQPRETYIALRGDFLRPDKETGLLHPGGLHAVAPELPAEAGRTRLDLARWLVDPANPLTPRVTINRIWLRYFGRGLVETEEDFGTQGTPPTHPELLDWLSGEFIRRRWSLKEMHRLIVMSATYRQASRSRSDLAEKDPRNLLLARQERVRVEAEVVRDAALAASGLLDPTIGGPSVRPPQPDGVYAFTQTQKKWTADSGPSRYRRGMYTLFFRSAPYPLFTTFDAPDFSTVCTRRIRSNTPLQALTVANDEAFVEISQGLAARVLKELQDGDADTRIRRAYILCLCRDPNSTELAALRGFFDRQLENLTADTERSMKLLSGDLQKFETPADAAAFVLVCRAILNTDAFITRE